MNGRGYGYDYGTAMMNGGGWGVGIVLLALTPLLIALLALVGGFVVHLSRAPHAASTPATPQARLLLDGRLAKGEVTPQEYQAIRTALET